MAYAREIVKQALSLLETGTPISEVAEILGVSRFTIGNWKRTEKEKKGETKETLEGLKKQLQHLSQKKPTEAVSRRIAMIAKAISSLERIEGKKILGQKPKPLVPSFSISGLREQVLNDVGMRQYQKNFLCDSSQFRIVLKARQIGFTYVAAVDALIGACEGRNQLFLSASEEQALILMRYVEMWAQRYGVKFLSDSNYEKTLESGVVIKALAHNFRTVQGFTGDVWMDEFAWYPNPKKIWHAFVPSIGAISGRLTIMSTPFEESALFHDLFFDEGKYFMFSRHRIDIYRAIEDGLTFDLEVMRALFDAETWASAYECQFIDDESALFPISLIKSCVDPLFSYHIPPHLSPLQAGFDVGRKKDSSALAALLSTEGGRYDLCVMDVLRRAPFEEQKNHIRAFMKTNIHARIKIDKTGIGMNLAEDVQREYRGRALGVSFTDVMKEAVSLNLKKMFEDRLIRIPNDPLLIADIHAIKRRAGARRFLYDADRNAHGHADRYWALALAASWSEILRAKRVGRGYIVG